MTRNVVVVGAGVAGLAAAWSARRAGDQVTVVDAGAGATALGSGAVDDAPWEEIERAARVLCQGLGLAAPPLSPACAAFMAELELWDLPAGERPWIATVAGRARPARGRDRALLELGRLQDAFVLVPRVDRAGWDADALAAALARSDLARSRHIAFRVVDVPVLRFEDERRAADAEIAARHDDAARIGWLAEQLRKPLAEAERAGAILLGPWLGASAPRAEALSEAVGLPCGEALVGAGSPAGLRFEAARDRLLEALGVRRVRDRATRVARNEGRSPGFSVALSVSETVLAAGAVVLAIGGVAGGGVVYAPPERGARDGLPPSGKVAFELSLEAPVALAAGDAERMDVVASMHGPELDLLAWPIGDRPGALETVGIRGDGTRAAPDLHAAGDALAGRPRTVLEAVTSGIAAGAAAATR